VPPEAGPGSATGPLSQLSADPYRVALGGGPLPPAVIAALSGHDRPGVLWGSWFGGGALLMHTPLRSISLVNASDGLRALDDQPMLRRPWDGLGGGWLACLGYSAGTSWLGFYDHLLRWSPDGTWTFETLGLPGREPAMAEALAGWRALLDTAMAGPVDQARSGRHFTVGEFQTDVQPSTAEERYLASVDHAISRIHRGDFYQVNLCTRLATPFAGDPLVMFAEVGETLRPAYGAFVSRPRPIASFSPELFLRVQGATVTTAPIKGTAPRDDGPSSESWRALRESTKDAAENVMIVDLMRNDLSRVCRPGSVVVEDLLGIEPHPGVWHLVSTVSGRLGAGVSVGDLLAATFPPGSVTGAPKLAAQRGIAELEAQSRGAYTGAIGFVTNTAAEFNVAIRSFEIDGDRLALGVGGGITVDSVPVREWYECLQKAAPLARAAGSRLDRRLSRQPPQICTAVLAGGVFETMLAVAGSVVRLADYLARLDRSCRELYGAGVPDDLARRVQHAAGVEPAARQAVRVSARPGRGELDFAIIVEELGTRPIESAVARASRPDRSWRHKWCHRSAFAAAETLVAPALPYFATPEGSVAETSRGAIFCLEADGVWRTPPLDEHLLPSVSRREVLQHLSALGVPYAIERFSTERLRHARAAWWTSSLSGAVRITAVDGDPLPPNAVSLAAEINRRLAQP